MDHGRVLSFRVLLSVLFFPALAPVQAEILVYGTKPKSWAGYIISQGSKQTQTPPSVEEGFYFWELDGVDQILDDEVSPRPKVLYRGIEFYPSSVYLSHSKKTKKVTGSLVLDDNPNSHSRTYYGRAIAPGGKRIFRALYQQWEDEGAPRDTGNGMLEGVCNLINVGGGKTGYYPLKPAFQIWRVDDSGSDSSYGDGRQIKYINQPLVLYEALTREINNQGLNISEAVIFAVGYLFPKYTELDPQISD